MGLTENDLPTRCPNGHGPIEKCGHEVADPKQVHYCDYLSLEALLHLISPHAAGEKQRVRLHHDETLFIVVHQIFEMLFSQHVLELKLACEQLDGALYPEALRTLRRVLKITRFYQPLVQLLLTMPQEHFASFRNNLIPASGLESEGFRLVEIFSGMRETSPYVVLGGAVHNYREFLDRQPARKEGPKTRLWTPRMSQAIKERNLHDVCCSVIGNETMLADIREAILAILAEYERTFLEFRKAHRDVVEFQIGNAVGTGMTLGLRFLDSVIGTARFFPNLVVL